MIILSSPNSDQNRVIEAINAQTDVNALLDLFDPNSRVIYNDIINNVSEALKYFNVINITIYPHMLYDKEIENLLESFDDVIILYRDNLLIQAVLHAWMSKMWMSEIDVNDKIDIDTNQLIDCIGVLAEVKRYLLTLKPKAFIRSEELHLFDFEKFCGFDFKISEKTIDLSSIAYNHEQLLGVEYEQ